MPIGVIQYSAGNNVPFHSAIEYWFSMWSTTKIEESSTIKVVQMIHNILIREMIIQMTTQIHKCSIYLHYLNLVTGTYFIKPNYLLFITPKNVKTEI